MNAGTLVNSSAIRNENENYRTNIGKVLAGIIFLVFALFVGGYGIIGYAMLSTWMAFGAHMFTVLIMGIVAFGAMILFSKQEKAVSSFFLNLAIMAAFLSVFCLFMACVFDYNERGSHYIRGQNSTLRERIVYGFPFLQDIYRVRRRYFLDFIYEAKQGNSKTPIRVLAELTLARDSMLFDKALFASTDRDVFVENDARLSLISQIDAALKEKGDTHLDWKGEGATSPTGATWTGKVQIMEVDSEHETI